MVDPKALADALPASGEPTFADRMRIRAGIGGVAALVRLEELCARRAYPHWRAAFPGDDDPMVLLEMALAGPDEHLGRALNALHTKLDDVMTPDTFRACYAGRACLTTARHALAGEITDPSAGNGELGIDPLDWTPCFLAGLAEAGGATWEPDTDVAARRAYWRWYLVEAVPSVG